MVLRSRPGFSLIELLLVVGIIGILALIVIVAINPAKQIDQVRNMQRTKDVNAILGAVYQYYADTKALPAGVAATPKGICRTGAESCKNGIDLTALTKDGKYLPAIPFDPLAPTVGTGTLYVISVDAQNRLTVAAPQAEGGATVSVSR
jgi:type IV pilus assembly protein PilA